MKLQTMRGKGERKAIIPNRTAIGKCVKARQSRPTPNGCLYEVMHQKYSGQLNSVTSPNLYYSTQDWKVGINKFMMRTITPCLPKKEHYLVKNKKNGCFKD